MKLTTLAIVPLLLPACASPRAGGQPVNTAAAAAAAVASTVASCGSTAAAPTPAPAPDGGLVPGLSARPGAAAAHATQPRATAYRTNGNWNNHVAVTMNADRTALVAYPDVADVGLHSAPLPLADGWLLDRRGGISTRTAFLDWTYADYSRLAATPAPAELMAHLLPAARVVEVHPLDLTLSEALADTARANRQLPAPLCLPLDQ